MNKQPVEATKLSMANTKKEMLAEYREVVKQLRARREAEKKPEQKIEEKRQDEAAQAADELSTAGTAREIGNLRSELGTMLVQLSDKLEEEIDRYRKVKTAVAKKEQELMEIYEIEKEATSLAALLETQRTKRAQFEAEIQAEKEELEKEIETRREEWEASEKAHEAGIKERDDAEKKQRARETEEYKYSMEREKQMSKEEFEYDKARLEREIEVKREELERDLSEREKAVKEGEAELSEMRKQVNAFPKELEAAVNKAVEKTMEQFTCEAQAREAMVTKEFTGERNVLNSRIDALQQALNDSREQSTKLAAQLEKSYGQVQDIAVKAIEGSSKAGALADLQTKIAERGRKTGQDEN